MKQTVLMMVMCFMALTMNAKNEKKTVVFGVPLHCESCVKKVNSNIAFEKGVKDIKCDIKAQTVAVTFVEGKTTTEQLTKAFAKIGFEGVKEVKQKCCSEKSECCKSKEEKEHEHEGHDHDEHEHAESTKSSCCSSSNK